MNTNSRKDGVNKDPTRIKICGLKTLADIELINEVRPEYCGFIVDYPKSHRSKTEEEVKILVSELVDEVVPVGVFVDPDPKLPIRMLKDGTIRIAQLHGSESDDTIRRVQEATGCQVIKAFIIESEADVERAVSSPADYILLDKGRGEGVTFDWSLVRDINRPYFLAGGLNRENIVEAINNLEPFAVDISSGVETDRYKDPIKVREMVTMVRNTVKSLIG